MDAGHLPGGWLACSIADVAEINPKKIDADSNLCAGFVPMALAPTDFKSDLNFDEKVWGEIKRSYTNFQDDDVIFAKVTPCFENGKAAIVRGLPNGIGAGSSEFYVLRPSFNFVSTEYLFGIIKTQQFMQDGAENMTGAVGLRRVPRAFVEGFPIALPPLAEQKVIAQKLDTLLAQVETTKARLDRIPDILKRFRQSVLAAAVSGKLTSSDDDFKSVMVKDTWSHEVEGLLSWQEYRFSDVVNVVGGSQPPKTEFRSEKKEGYIRLIQIRDYKSDRNVVYIPIEKAKRFVDKKEVMIGRYGPPIFQILRGLEGAYNVALMKAEPNEEVLDNDYLYWFLQNYKLFSYIEAGSDRTAGQSGVNKKHLESYPILLPSLEEQAQIIEKVEFLFAHADAIEKQVQAAQARVNSLTQSILAKAFRGELTAEWRAANSELISGENSAEALLEKIRAEREAVKPKRKTKSKA